MDPARWSKLEQLFEKASSLTPAERAALLDRECADDPELRDEVERLLACHTESDATFHDAVAAAAESARPGGDGSEAGRIIGPYRVDREIGRGGMGTVYLAVRADDQYRKQVAIKVMRHRTGRDDLLQRFRTERQILATLEHPNVARMLDGGTTESGEPYVVMEYVEGRSLDRYCDDRKLDTRERLKLFRRVCDAVQYAHRNLVIHRDIKPGNVLVTDDGTVKLLDFGIAKLLDPAIAPHTVAETAMESRLLTPEYASPEQVQGNAISTATDVYSLGVMLYELLTGRRPYRLTRLTTADLERAIVEQDPERPSTAIGRRETTTAGTGSSDPETIGRHRSTVPDRLKKQLAGDLDNIVLMALRKEPARRYASAEALSEDIDRHLHGLPVRARPLTWGYRTQKFVRRHVLAVASAVAVVAIIGLLVGFYTLRLQDEAERARAAEQQAVSEARNAEATAEFLVQLFAAADPREAGRRDIIAEDLVYAGLERLRDDETLDAATRAELRLILGLCLSNLGNRPAAIESIRLSVAEREELYGRRSLETAEALHRLGDVLRHANRFEEGLPLLMEALEIREELLEGDSYEMADSYNNMAIMVVNLGEYAESDRLQTQSVEMHTRMAGPDAAVLAVPLNNLALLKRRQGKLGEAAELSRRAYEILQQGTDRSSTLRALNHRCVIWMEQGQPEHAREQLAGILEERLVLLGPEHPTVINTRRDIARCLLTSGRLEEARHQLEDLVRIAAEALGVESRRYASSRGVLADLETMEGDTERAETIRREVLATFLSSSGPRHFAVPGRRRRLAESLMANGKHEEARSQLELAVAAFPDPAAYPHVERARSTMRLAQIDLEGGDLDGAARAVEAAGQIVDLTSGLESLEGAQLELVRAELALARGDREASAGHLQIASDTLARFVPEAHPDRRRAARLLEETGR